MILCDINIMHYHTILYKYVPTPLDQDEVKLQGASWTLVALAQPQAGTFLRDDRNVITGIDHWPFGASQIATATNNTRITPFCCPPGPIFGGFRFVPF